MPPAWRHRPVPTDGDRLARTRERFLTAEPVEPDSVRDTILASWWRSRRWNVAADHIDLSYVRDPDLDTPLTRSALPILRNLRDHLDGQPISVILTDPTGVVLTRLVADHDLERHLNGVHLAPGFSYAEEFVGTNGIGTALEGGGPMHVFGHEHYAENLEDLACAGVPIRHPISGKTVGAVDLTCWRRDAGPLLIALAKTTADQIKQALLTDSGIREYQLLQEFLRACRRTSGIVFALNSDVVMMSEYAREVLDPGDQSVLLAQAADALAARHAGPVEVDLPTGARARLHLRPVRPDDPLAGGIAHAKLVDPGGGHQLAEAPARAPLPPLPGLVGSEPLWLRACHRVDALCGTGEWLAVEGEPGVGKLAVLRAAHQRRHPAGGFHVLDAADGGRPDWLARAHRELADGSGTVVITHLDRLGDRALHALAAELREARQRPTWVAVTLSHRADRAGLDEVLRFLPSTVEVPPLRHHIEDLHELVPHFLTRLNPDGPPTCSPETTHVLMRASWPGNVEQVWQVLRRTVQQRRTGILYPEDLPPEVRAVSRRLLSPLESMERDAIVQSLLDSGGNKLRAAESLGMSRATIYRKIHQYGIVSPG